MFRCSERRTHKRALRVQVESEAPPQHLTISLSASACSSADVKAFISSLRRIRNKLYHSECDASLFALLGSSRAGLQVWICFFVVRLLSGSSASVPVEKHLSSVLMAFRQVPRTVTTTTRDTTDVQRATDEPLQRRGRCLQADAYNF